MTTRDAAADARHHHHEGGPHALSARPGTGLWAIRRTDWDGVVRRELLLIDVDDGSVTEHVELPVDPRWTYWQGYYMGVGDGRGNAWTTYIPAAVVIDEDGNTAQPPYQIAVIEPDGSMRLHPGPEFVVIPRAYDPVNDVIYAVGGPGGNTEIYVYDGSTEELLRTIHPATVPGQVSQFGNYTLQGIFDVAPSVDGRKLYLSGPNFDINPVDTFAFHDIVELDVADGSWRLFFRDPGHDPLRDFGDLPNWTFAGMGLDPNTGELWTFINSFDGSLLDLFIRVSASGELLERTFHNAGLGSGGPSYYGAWDFDQGFAYTGAEFSPTGGNHGIFRYERESNSVQFVTPGLLDVGQGIAGVWGAPASRRAAQHLQGAVKAQRVST